MKRNPTMVPAIVTKVVPSDRRVGDSFTGQVYEYGNYTVVVEQTKERREHILVNGSLNGLPAENRKKGLRGYIYWAGQSGYHLPFFTSSARRMR